MSSVDDDPQLTERLLEECLELLSEEPDSGIHTQALRAWNEEAFFRQGGSFPHRLALMLEERTSGKRTVLAVDHVVVPHPQSDSVYFAVYSADEPAEEPVVEPRIGMVLCEINMRSAELSVGLAFNTPEEIEEAKRQRVERIELEKRRTLEARQLREAVNDEFDRTMNRLEFYIERSGDYRIQQDWQPIRRKYNRYPSDVSYREVLEIVHRLGLDMATVTSPLPT